MRNICKHCNGWGTRSLFKRDICKFCGGDGFAKPTGWPDKDLMRKLRPPAPVAPPSRARIL